MPMTKPPRRRTPLAIALALAVGLAAPASASALNVYAAASLREVFTQIDAAPTFNFAGSNVAADADPERRAGRRVRLRQPAGGAGAVQERQLRAAGHVRDEQAHHDRAQGQPRRRALGLQPAQGRPARGDRDAGRADRRPTRARCSSASA